MEIDYSSFLICVRCITYNHSDTIVDTMNGFSMQQTSFPFVCVILDDASNDGEQLIIEDYLNQNFNLSDNSLFICAETDDYRMTFAQHRTNKNCFFAVYLLKYNHYSISKNKNEYILPFIKNSPYLALCEGDDCWITPQKLSMQIGYMENHPDCSMCFHNAICYYVQENSVSLFNDYSENRDLSLHEAISEWEVPTASMLLRSKYYEKPEWMATIYSGDYSLILRCYHGGRVYGFKNIMSIYRINSEGSSATARMKNRLVFMAEQQILLLNSFNKGTGFKYNDEIEQRITILRKEIRFQKQRESRSCFALFNPLFYSKAYRKVIRLLVKYMSK